MTQLSPSILSADFANLGQQCRAVLEAGAEMLHFDVMDGHFVPNLSFGVPVLQSLHKALPEAFFDVHLMITHPLDYVEAFAKAADGRATKIIIPSEIQSLAGLAASLKELTSDR